jgi:hypothetical protein
MLCPIFLVGQPRGVPTATRRFAPPTGISTDPLGIEGENPAFLYALVDSGGVADRDPRVTDGGFPGFV